MLYVTERWRLETDAAASSGGILNKDLSLDAS